MSSDLKINTSQDIKKTLNVGGRLVELSPPLIMGILNITPDSFFKGGRVSTSPDEVLQRAGGTYEQGAAILDIGGYSTRPGALEVSQAEELDRVLPVIQSIRKHVPDALISVDTFRAGVALEAVRAGADIINDVSGGTLDAAMFDTVAALKVPYVLMHMRGTPQTMTKLANYERLVPDILKELQQKLVELRQKGVADIIIDPGFGFAKTVAQNFRLMRSLSEFHQLGCPLLVGVSRKSMVWRTLGVTAEEALNGTTVLNTLALQQGADILRVHDVREAAEAVKLWQLTVSKD
ncbi:dihydropteroate synthase [Telluribacter sp. SYSU D00476]|uniref:dihydropteroate synthase n=1 Tax=Telluribacter sp. SYSU D00476 TaxID=2811430 RepID=UPI001FF11EB6|nr:dihydropteroate synthase [Telluribacter sp. SYSU D00476]